jgi:hypothetical protein
MLDPSNPRHPSRAPFPPLEAFPRTLFPPLPQHLSLRPLRHLIRLHLVPVRRLAARINHMGSLKASRRTHSSLRRAELIRFHRPHRLHKPSPTPRHITHLLVHSLLSHSRFPKCTRNLVHQGRRFRLVNRWERNRWMNGHYGRTCCNWLVQ